MFLDHGPLPSDKVPQLRQGALSWCFSPPDDNHDSQLSQPTPSPPLVHEGQITFSTPMKTHRWAMLEQDEWYRVNLSKAPYLMLCYWKHTDEMDKIDMLMRWHVDTLSCQDLENTCELPINDGGNSSYCTVSKTETTAPWRCSLPSHWSSQHLPWLMR